MIILNISREKVMVREDMSMKNELLKLVLGEIAATFLINSYRDMPEAFIILRLSREKVTVRIYVSMKNDLLKLFLEEGLLTLSS